MLGHLGTGESARVDTLRERYARQALGVEPSGLAFDFLLAHARTGARPPKPGDASTAAAPTQVA